MEYVVILFFLFAVLAAGYFYLQRAKSRSATTPTETDGVQSDRG